MLIAKLHLLARGGVVIVLALGHDTAQGCRCWGSGNVAWKAQCAGALASWGGGSSLALVAGRLLAQHPAQAAAMNFCKSSA